MKKKISAAALHCLKEALTFAFWYKNDLRSFLINVITDSRILAKVNWEDRKRNIVSSIINYMGKNESQYQSDLLHLMSEVSQMTDFTHLLNLDDGKSKEQLAKQAVGALKIQMRGHLELEREKQDIKKRREQALEEMMQSKGVRERLDAICKNYYSLLKKTDHRQRGFDLEKILRDLFEIFDLDPKASFRITGEQIDGAFTFDGTDYILEAKWQEKPVTASELYALDGKISGKLDNTLGLYVSINGYSRDAVDAYSAKRRLLILMNGSDIMAVLEGRIDLAKLLLRKRREASTTGNIYLRIQEILG